MLADLGQQVFDMALPRSLIGLHSVAPYKEANRRPASTTCSSSIALAALGERANEDAAR
jgi:hypothetical protein